MTMLWKEQLSSGLVLCSSGMMPICSVLLNSIGTLQNTVDGSEESPEAPSFYDARGTSFQICSVWIIDIILYRPNRLSLS